MKFIKVFGIVSLFLFSLVPVAAFNNTFMGVGDSVTYAVPDVLATQRYTYLVAQNLSLNESNQGIRGSCLTDGTSCSTQNPLINRYTTDVIPENAKYVFFLPNINDARFNPSPSEYRADLETFYNAVSVSDSTYLTSSIIWHGNSVNYPQEEASFHTAEVREHAIINKIPFIELHYVGNHNSSLRIDEVHPNVAGQQIIADLVLDAIANPEDYTMNSSAFNIYHDCDNAITILNYTLLSSSNNCGDNTNADWIILKNINENSILVERADDSFILNISALYGNSQQVNISYSNGTDITDTTTAGGILTLNIQPATNLLITLNGLASVTTSINNMVSIDASDNSVSQYLTLNGFYYSAPSSVIDFLNIIWEGG